MRKTICFILLFSILIMLAGCSKQQRNAQHNVTFYYRKAEIEYGKENGVLAAESFDVTGHENDLSYILRKYISGPRSSDCVSPFPAGTELVEFSYINSKAIVVLSSHISMLTGSDLTLACACITKTVTELTNFKSVQIMSEKNMIDNNPSLIFTVNDFAFLDFG